MMAGEIQNLLADASRDRSYFIAETMGRSAGWLAYGVAIAGEANLVISVEDITGKYRDSEEYVNSKTGERDPAGRWIVDRSRPADRGHDAASASKARQALRRDRAGRGARRVCCPPTDSRACRATSTATSRSRRSTSARTVRQARRGSVHRRRPGKSARSPALQLGYESRCAPPHAFDVMLGSQLGVGAYRALVEEKLDGVMVSVSGQLDLQLRPVREAGRPGDARHRGPLHPGRLRLPPARPVPRDLYPGLSRCVLCAPCRAVYPDTRQGP